MEGYVSQPELTAEKRFPHPQTGELLYDTSDLVQWVDGKLQYKCALHSASFTRAPHLFWWHLARLHLGGY